MALIGQLLGALVAVKVIEQIGVVARRTTFPAPKMRAFPQRKQSVFFDSPFVMKRKRTRRRF